MVGEEGAEFDNRDYRKLTEVIVGEYLAEPNPTYRSVTYFLCSISETSW